MSYNHTISFNAHKEKNLFYANSEFEAYYEHRIK